MRNPAFGPALQEEQVVLRGSEHVEDDPNAQREGEALDALGETVAGEAINEPIGSTMRCSPGKGAETVTLMSGPGAPRVRTTSVRASRAHRRSWAPQAAGIEPVGRAIENPKQDALLPANALNSNWIVPPLRPISSRLAPFNSPLEGHTGGTCGPTGSIHSRRPPLLRLHLRHCLTCWARFLWLRLCRAQANRQGAGC